MLLEETTETAIPDITLVKETSNTRILYSKGCVLVIGAGCIEKYIYLHHKGHIHIRLQ